MSGAVVVQSTPAADVTQRLSKTLGAARTGRLQLVMMMGKGASCFVWSVGW
jgi:hypothetical protein